MRRTLCTTLVGLALALAACGGDDDNGGDNGSANDSASTEQTETTAPETTAPEETTEDSPESEEAGNKYPAQIRENFMTSCERSSNGQTAVCRCSLEKIEEEYSLEEFEAIDEKQRKEGGELPAEMQQIVQECVREEG